MIPRMLALTDVSATIGLVAIFFVIFPLLVHVLVGLAVGQALGERAENQAYRKHGHNSNG
jgi:hypothetical protein